MRTGDAAPAVSIEAVLQPARTSAWHTTPSTYVICTDDHAFDPVLQERMARRATRTVRISSSHSLFFSHAAELRSF
jgi:hypothetical protein